MKILLKKFGINQLNASAGYNVEQSFYTQCKWKHNRSMECKSSEQVSSIIIKKCCHFEKGQEFSDGEQKVAVLPNGRMLVMMQFLFVKEGQTKTFVLEKI